MRTILTAFFLILTFTIGAVAGDKATVDPLSELFQYYYGIGTQLTNDSVTGARDNAKKLAELAGHIFGGHISIPEGKLKTLKHPLEKTSKSATKIAQLNDLSKIRKEFVNLSNALATIPVSLRPKDANPFNCPHMNIIWFDKGTKVKNPYGGKEELACGYLFRGSDDLLSAVLDEYYRIWGDLAADKTQNVAEAKKAMLTQSYSLEAFYIAEGRTAALVQTLRQSIEKLDPKGVNEVREGFSKLSDNLIAILKKYPPKGVEFHIFKCPMVKQKWVQPEKKIKNPYLGKKMPACGTELKA